MKAIYKLTALCILLCGLFSCQRDDAPNRQRVSNKQEQDKPEDNKQSTENKETKNDSEEGEKDKTKQEDKPEDKSKESEKEQENKDKPEDKDNNSEPKPAPPSNLNSQDFGIRARGNEALLLKGEYSEQLRDMLNHLEFTKQLPMGETHIQPHELQEIKATADQVVAKAGAKTDREKHDALFKWIAKEIKYEFGVPNILDISSGQGHTYNTAYTTFKERKAICQGYANLLKVMLYTQGISSAVVNGMTRANGRPEGHAWNYALLDGKWYISDPTFRNLERTFFIDDISKYRKILEAERIDFPLGGDGAFECMFTGGEVTIHKVKQAQGHSLKLPEVVSGFVVTCFNPIEMPANIREVHLGAKVQNLGRSDRRYLSNSGMSVGNNLERIYVDPANPYIQDYKGVLYARNARDNKETNEIIFIPKRLRVAHLKPGMGIVTKNTITNLPGLEELHFPSDTKELVDAAVEYCPKLQYVYLPEGTKYSQKSFYNCHPNLKVIKQ